MGGYWLRVIAAFGLQCLTVMLLVIVIYTAAAGVWWFMWIVPLVLILNVAAGSILYEAAFWHKVHNLAR